MFEYEFNRAEELLSSLVEYQHELDRIPNPGGTTRFLQHLFGPSNSDESYAAQQARHDKRRAEIAENAKAAITDAGEAIRPIIEWMKDHECAKGILSMRSCRALRGQGLVRPGNIQRFLSDLREVHQLVSLTEEAERIAESESVTLRSALEQVARERGVDLAL
ncbi:MAG: hypothetical protein ABIG71_03355, partial [Candidatus Uhrbacteria bacterium]